MTGLAIQQRFAEEVAFTQAHLDMVRNRLMVYGDRVRRVIATLHYRGVLAGDMPLLHHTYGVALTHDEMRRLRDVLWSVRAAIEARAARLRADCEQLPPDLIDEWRFESLGMQALNLTAEAHERHGVLSRWAVLAGERDRLALDLPEPQADDPPDTNEADVDSTAERWYEFEPLRQLDELEEVVALMGELEVLVRAGEPDSTLNVWRQAFIVTLTAFDATVFDLVRIALQRDFFRLISALADKDKLALSDLRDYGSFEALRDSVIDDKLRKQYLKDLLLFIDGEGVQCVSEADGLDLADLVEIVLRRNIHVHNRGIVDGRYLGGGPGKAQFNVYNLRDRDLAEIDARYWQKASSLCSDCVIRIAAWVDSLPT